VVVVRSIAQTTRLGQSLAAGVGPGAPIPVQASYTAPFGMVLPAAIYAMKARRHMSLYGTITDHFAEVAVNARRNAVNNPDARFRTEITVEEHHASRLIADPLRLYDCCMESDGAAAVIVTSPERARDLPQPPVSIRAVSMTVEYKWATASFNTTDEVYASTGHRRAPAGPVGARGPQGERYRCADEVEGFPLGAGRLGEHREGGGGAGEADLVAGQGGQVVQQAAEAAVGPAGAVVLL
jgi:acetyl-CoA acetyltransferase